MPEAAPVCVASELNKWPRLLRMRILKGPFYVQRKGKSVRALLPPWPLEVAEARLDGHVVATRGRSDIVGSWTALVDSGTAHVASA